jgi:replicative DNA helicase
MIAGPKTDKRATEGTSQFIDSKAFAAKKYPRRWLVENILVEGQPAVIGGPKKCLKTGLALDLAISVGTGTPFLGKFAVPRPHRVAVMSGESGEATIQETARRICRAKEVSLEEARRVIWAFKLPRLQDDDYRTGFTAMLREKQVKLVIIDPLYLCLFDGAPGMSASNLYEVGPLLLRAARTCLDAGATPVVVHHATKSGGKQAAASAKPLELDDLMFSGIGEFARQWLLVSRTATYCMGSGEHKLLVTVGGSAGQSGCWQLDIREGTIDADFQGRDWSLKIGPHKLDSQAKPLPPKSRNGRSGADFLH